jgi:hypothetical protein
MEFSASGGVQAKADARGGGPTLGDKLRTVTASVRRTFGGEAMLAELFPEIGALPENAIVDTTPTESSAMYTTQI